MLDEMPIGTSAGVTGVVALKVAAHGDMAVRGRPASSVPALEATIARDVFAGV